MPLFVRAKPHPTRLGAFRRGLLTSPFQIPLLVYLTIQGILICLNAHSFADQLGLHSNWGTWSIVNLGVILAIGGGLATFSRFNDNERLESFGLLLLILAVMLSAAISVSAHNYDLGDEVAIGTGCYLRARVLRKARKAQKVAIQINNDNEGAGS